MTRASDRSDEPRHPIGVVARRTGLNIHVLRAWERRHGVVEPGRTEGGTRRYSDRDVEKLKLLGRLVEAGHPIGDVAGLALDELERLAAEAPAAARPGERAGAEEQGSALRAGAPYVEECLAKLAALDAPAVHGVLMRAVLSLRSREFVTGVAVPVLHRVGELWESGELRPSQEHTLSVAMERALGWLLGSVAMQPGAPVLVASTPPGELHAFGAMLAGVVAADEGWNVVYLGPNLPVEDLLTSVVTTGASVLALSVVMAPDAARRRELRRLAAAPLPHGGRLVVGGGAAALVEGELSAAGASVFNDYEQLRSLLRERGTGAGLAGGPGEGS